MSRPVRSLPPAQWMTTPPSGAFAIARIAAATLPPKCSRKMRYTSRVALGTSGAARAAESSSASISFHSLVSVSKNGMCSDLDGQLGRRVRFELLVCAQVDDRLHPVVDERRPARSLSWRTLSARMIES